MIKGAEQHRGFSFKGKGSFSGGGVIGLHYANTGTVAINRAASVVFKYRKRLSMFQIRREWKVSYKAVGGKRITKAATGFSPPVMPNRMKSQKGIAKLISVAINNSAVAAAKDIGLTAKYEGSIPQGVKPKEKGFDLLLWFDGKNRQSFLG